MKFTSSVFSIASALCILAGAPVSAQQAAYGPNNILVYPNVRVCVEERGEATCYNVPSNDPDLLKFTEKNKPELNKVHIPVLSDLYEGGILFWFSLLFLLGASSVAASWMILNWKKIRPTDPH